ncbi:TPA: nucleoside kinase [Candidatus Acetothermia bacterium]|nr:nucleoside kinase [Candidatus Acetothermia bacterium]
MNRPLTDIHLTERRSNVQVCLLFTKQQEHSENGQVFEGPRNTPLESFLRFAFPDCDDPPVAGIIDGKLRELTQPITHDVDVEPVFLSDSDGIRIYCRTLSFLLIVATHQLYPDARLFIDYSVPYGGYFCKVEGRESFSSQELRAIRTRMEQLVDKNLPIRQENLLLEEACSLLAARGEKSQVQLLRRYQKKDISLYTLAGFSDYFYGHMLPSTGYLTRFALEPFAGGFVLRFPRREEPTKIAPAQSFTVLREVFSEYGQWLSLLDVRHVGDLNEAISTGRIEEIMLVSEALHEGKIAQIARSLTEHYTDGYRTVFIAGPSSSGKTSFAKRLAVQLLAHGVSTHLLSLDDYFLPYDQLPRDAQGEVNFDALSALDLPLFARHLCDLLADKSVNQPHFDFLTGERKKGLSIRLTKDQLVLIEGIHALNPELLRAGRQEKVLRIFVSAITQLNLDSHNRISTTDTRLIRRIVRDALFRGYSAEETLSLWKNVRRGEKENIFRYQEEVDVMFNSALVYELSVLKPFAEPLLLQVRDPKRRVEAERLLSFLQWFEVYESDAIPNNSILREFIGGSILADFRL